LRIRRISLENFGSHQKTDISFTDGINAIIGNNGAGKTTILEAIAYALYHRASRQQDELIRIGAPYMRVTLEFEADGKSYIVTRERRRDGGVSAELHEITERGRRLLQRDQSKVSSQIEAILGFSRDVFLQGIYVRQGEIQELLESQPSKRKEIIARLLGIDILERLWEELRGVIDKLDSEIRGIDREIAAIGDVDRERLEIEGKIEEIERELSDLDSQRRTLQSRIEELKNLVDEIEEKRRKFIELKSKITEIEERIEQNEKKKKELEKDLIRIDESLSKLPEVEKIASKFDEISKLRDLTMKLSELRRNREAADERLGELKALEEEISEIEGRRKDLDRIKELIEEKRGERQELTKLSMKLADLKEEESDLLRKIDEIKVLSNKEISSLREIVEGAPEDPEEALKFCSRFSEELKKKLEGIDQNMKNLNDEIAVLRERINNYSIYLGELSTNPERCPLCGSKLTIEVIERLKEDLRRNLDEMRAEISEIEGKLRELDSERELTIEKIGRVDEISKRLMENLEELKSIDDSLKRVKDDMMCLSERIAELETSVRDLDDLEENYRKLMSDIERVGKLKERAERLRELLAGVDLDKMRQEISYLEGEINSLMRELNVVDIEEEYQRSKNAFIEFEKLKGLLRERERISSILNELSKEISLDIEKVRELSEKIASLGFDENALSKAKSELNEAEGRMREIIRTKGELEGAMSELKKKIDELIIKSERLRKLRERKERYENFRSKILKIREIFSRDKGIQASLRERAKPIIERELNEIFSSFGFDYDSIELDENFTPILRRGGKEYSFDILSGGERISLALALRLAIARYLVSTKIECFILDEPTIHLDDERIESLLEALSSLQIPQVIVVTHSPRFRDIASRSILVSKVNGISNIEILEDVMVSD
jgi:exonuclease SbcC